MGAAPIGPPEANATKFQNMLEQVAKLLKATGGPLAGAAGTTQTGTAARTPGVPNPQPPAMPQGSMAAALPQMQPQGPMPQAPSAFGGVTPGRETAGGSFQYATPKARNAAVVTNAIQQFSQLAQGIHQKKFEQQVAESTQIWQTYLQKVKALEAAKQSGDQEQIQAAQQDLQKFAQDKKVAKILATVSDPKKAMSPQSIGVQRAMQASQQQAVQQAELEKTQAETRQKQSQAAQEEATAAWRRKQEQMVGQVTPELRSKEETELTRTQKIVDGMTERSKQQVKAQGDRTQAMITSNEKVASGHDAALERIAKMRAGDKDVEHLTKEQGALTAQINSLNKEAKDIIDGIAKNPNTSWLNGDKEKAAKQLQNIEARRQALEKQQKAIQDKWAAMYMAGKMPDPNNPPPAAVSDAGGSGDVSNEDFNRMLDDRMGQQPGSQYNEN